MPMPDRLESDNTISAPAGRSVKKGSALRASLEALLLGSAVVLLAIYGAAHADRFFTSRALLRAMPAVNSSERPAVHSGTDTAGGSLPEDLSPGDTTRKMGEDGKERPLAVLRIPKIHLEVAVLDGSDAVTLNHAAGRIEGTARPGQDGNIGIAAHRDSFFRNLGQLRTGDRLELETSRGTDTYIVDGIQIVMPTDVSVLDPRPSPSLTLVTCYPFGYLGRAPQRYIVTASLAARDQGTPHRLETVGR